jgi:hypothetical protein
MVMDGTSGLDGAHADGSRKRSERRAMAADHNRWPIIFFAKRGLLSMAKAHAMASQSSQR